MMRNPPLGGDRSKTVDRSREEDYPEVVEGSAEHPVGLRGDTQATVYGQDMTLKQHEHGDRERMIIHSLPPGTRSMLGLG